MSVLLDILTEIGDTAVTELAARPVHDLDRVVRQLGVLKEQVRACDSVLQAALSHRYQEQAQRQRLFAGKATGTVRFEDGDYVVIADLPKRPEYDQAKLKAAVDTLRGWGETPEDYVSFEIKVAESRYTAWPPAIRKLFEPARTLKTGKPSFKLEARTAADQSEVA
jgi:hypothetical protein